MTCSMPQVVKVIYPAIEQNSVKWAAADQRLLDEALAIVRQAGEDGAFAMHRGPRGETKDLYHWARMYSCERSPDRL